MDETPQSAGFETLAMAITQARLAVERRLHEALPGRDGSAVAEMREVADIAMRLGRDRTLSNIDVARLSKISGEPL